MTSTYWLILAAACTSTSDDASTGDTSPETPAKPEPVAAVFGGGPFYTESEVEDTMATIKASRFDTVFLWSLHVRDTGTLVLNGDVLVEDGAYVGRANWPSQVASLKEAPTNVNRIEISAGSAGVPDFENMQALIEQEGTGPDSILYRNFAALREALPMVDAIDYDDESNYDVDSTVELSRMLADLGYKLTFVPYTNTRFWVDVYDQLEAERPGVVDRVYVQAYAGGAGNRPSAWTSFPNATLHFGLWSLAGPNCTVGDTPRDVRQQMREWRDEIDGGFMWLLDDMLACRETHPVADYAESIKRGLGAPAAE